MKKQAATSYFDYSKELLAVLNAQGEFVEVNSAWKAWIGENAGSALLGTVFKTCILQSDQTVFEEGRE